MHSYDDVFYEYINIGSVKSARVVIPYISEIINVSSVLDVGCGQGAWLSIWKDQADIEVVGLDGGYINSERLMIDERNFFSIDVSEKFDLNKKFSLCQCLEVAEHIKDEYSDTLIRNLCIHSDVVFFSAASVGQGGENHVNEKPYSYWKNKFHSNDYDMFDPIRSRLVKHNEVEVWYKNNIFIFVRKGTKYSDILSDFKVESDHDIKDYASLTNRSIKFCIRLLPIRVMTFIAILKKYIFVMIYKIKRHLNVSY